MCLLQKLIRVTWKRPNKIILSVYVGFSEGDTVTQWPTEYNATSIQFYLQFIYYLKFWSRAKCMIRDTNTSVCFSTRPRTKRLWIISELPFLPAITAVSRVLATSTNHFYSGLQTEYVVVSESPSEEASLQMNQLKFSWGIYTQNVFQFVYSFFYFTMGISYILYILQLYYSYL
jgi:hypothetical protein